MIHDHEHESGVGLADWRIDNSLARAPKISELVARELAKRIIDERLEEGTLLPNERELIEIFGVGRTTLREALRLLETRGVITIRTGPRGGPIVRRPRSEDLSDSLALVLQFEGAALSDVLGARTATESTVAALAAEQITPAEIEALAASVDRMEMEGLNGDAFRDENSEFHRLVRGAAGSVALRMFLGSLDNIVRSMLANLDYSQRHRSLIIGGHRRIVDALRAHDPLAAEQAMRDHLLEASRFWDTEYSHIVGSDVNWK